MKREILNREYKARKVERAIEELIGFYIEKLSLKANVCKFVDNEDECAREIKWDITLENKGDIEKLKEILDIPYIDVEECGNCLVVLLSWKSDNADEQFNLERKIAKDIETILGQGVFEGYEDIKILKGKFYSGNVENLIFK